MSIQYEKENPLVFAVKHKDLEIRLKSRSGGIFTAISDYILENNGVVFGCALDKTFYAVHKKALTKDDRNKFRGSKYIQSDLKNTFQEVKKYLEVDREVLFSGTSCQIAGLKSYLGKTDCSKLLVIDIVCHGVPSPKVWKDYLKYQGKLHDGLVTNVDFRNKIKYGWKEHVETIEIDGKPYDSKIFTTLFYGHSILRPCCYKCPYKSVMHPGDITIADFWGIEKAAVNFDDNKGVSLVLVNSSKGQYVFEKIKNPMDIRECKIEDSLQQPLVAPFPEPPERNRFWKEYQIKPFKYIAKKYGGAGLVYKIFKKIKNIFRKLKKFLGWKVGYE